MLVFVCAGGATHANEFVANDIFGLEYASDPQIAPMANVSSTYAIPWIS